MMNNATRHPEAAAHLKALADRLEALHVEHQRLHQEEQQLLQELLPVQQRREDAISDLRGSVISYGDIISPTGEQWEAEQ